MKIDGSSNFHKVRSVYTSSGHWFKGSELCAGNRCYLLSVNLKSDVKRCSQCSVKHAKDIFRFCWSIMRRTSASVRRCHRWKELVTNLLVSFDDVVHFLSLMTLYMLFYCFLIVYIYVRCYTHLFVSDCCSVSIIRWSDLLDGIKNGQSPICITYSKSSLSNFHFSCTSRFEVIKKFLDQTVIKH